MTPNTVLEAHKKLVTMKVKRFNFKLVETLRKAPLKERVLKNQIYPILVEKLTY